LAKSIESLPADQRAKHYRDLAADAVHDAEASTNPALKEGFLRLATQWHKMAQEAEQLAAEQSGPLPPSSPIATDEQPNGN